MATRTGPCARVCYKSILKPRIWIEVPGYIRLHGINNHFYKMLRTCALLAFLCTVDSASLGDIKHVVMLMQENRSFMHVSRGEVPGDA